MSEPTAYEKSATGAPLLPARDRWASGEGKRKTLEPYRGPLPESLLPKESIIALAEALLALLIIPYTLISAERFLTVTDLVRSL